MNALRTLPILNRPSRPASPAPAPSTTHVSTTTATGATTYPLVNGNGNANVNGNATANGHSSDPKARSRSLSRNLADKVAALQVNPQQASQAPGQMNPPHVPLKKSPSPPTSRAATPRLAPGPLPSPALTESVPAPQGGYMDVIGLRLNEAVNKASAGVDYKQKKGFKQGAGWGVGEAVVKELPFPPNDAYLIRAVLRTAVRSISIYITRLESLLLPALTDAAFASSLTLAPPAAHPLNPAQYHALTIAHAAWETCEVLEQTLETGQWPRFMAETLRPVMDKLDLVVGKVVQPLLLTLKRDLIANLNNSEAISPPGGKVLGLPSVPVPSAGPAVAIAREHSNPPLSRLTKEISERGHARQLPIPSCLQHFASRVDGAHKVLALIGGPCQDDGEGWITGVVVAVAWKGISVIAEKELGFNTARPPSPAAVSKALHHLSKEKDLTPTVVSSPSLGTVTSKLANPLSILPSRSASRPASPPRNAPKYDPRTLALMSLEGLIKRLVGTLVPPLSSGPVDPNTTEHLAREALQEAQEAVASFRIVSAAMAASHPATRILYSLRRVRDDIDDTAEEALDDAIEDMPAISLFYVLQRQANSLLPDGIRVASPHDLLGRTFSEYIANGFGAAEKMSIKVAQAMAPNVEKVLGELKEYGGDAEAAEAMEWVKALGVALDARCGVKIMGLN